METSIISRLTIPAIVSVMGLAITQIWYLKNSNQKAISRSTENPLAILSTKNEVIERRPAARIIWENLREGETLYNGEAVRTSSSASGKITFIKSGMSIGIEPDSLVIIEESAGKLELNLVNGGVFVKNDTPVEKNKSRSSQPILKAGDKKIELNSEKSAEMNLSVSESGTANISVTKGQVKVADKTGSAETVAEGKTKALTSAGPAIIEAKGPPAGTPIPITGTNDLLKITWSNVPVGAMVFVEVGFDRQKQTRIGTGVPAKAGSIDAPLPTGSFFWRLVAETNGKIVAVSPVAFNQSIALEAPMLIENSNGEKIILKQDMPSMDVRLSWSTPKGAEKTMVILARDPEFKNIVESKQFSTESEWAYPVKEAGTHYWRVAASWPGIAKKILSKSGSFNVTKQKEVPAPTIDDKLRDMVYSKPQVDENGILMSWRGQQGVESYSFKLEKQSGQSYKELISKQITALQYRITNVPSGVYRWSVRSRIGETESKTSANANFKVLDVAHMSLVDAAVLEKNLEFISPTFSYLFPLTGVPAGTSHLRFRIALQPNDIKSATWQPTEELKQLKFQLPKEGSYKLIVEALDKTDNTIGISDTMNLTAKAPEPLNPPRLLTGKQSLKTGESGDINLKWTAISGAKRYLVEIVGPKTKFRKEVVETSIELNHLFPGTHELVLTSIDKFDRRGRPGESIKIIVPNISSIAAPAAKVIKIR